MHYERSKGIRFCAGVLLACGMGAGVLHAQGLSPIAKWSFQQGRGDTVCDSIHGADGKIDGFYRYVHSVLGDALRFDGYTTSVTIPAKKAPSVGTNGFTVDALVALNTYPWNWLPVVDQERE